MKKIFVVCVLASVFANTALGQGKVRPRNECLKACNEVDSFTPLERFDRKLAEVREKKKNETDPGKLERLAEEEQELLEERVDKRQDVCNYICEHNPG
jgi:hypothetical protein